MLRKAGMLLLIVGLAIIAVASVEAAEPPIRFAVIGDRTGTANDSAYGLILDAVERMQPDFAITVGDQIEGYTEDTLQMLAEWKEYLALAEKLSVPRYYAPGNHDITTPAMEEMYRRHAGEPYYSFDFQGRHFIVLDNTPGGGGPAPDLGDDQLKWLQADLEKQTHKKQILVFLHKPFWYELAALGKPDTLHTLFVKFGVDAVFTGHYHSYFSAEIDGILYTGIGSSGGRMSPGPTGIGYHFGWVTVTDTISIAIIDIGAIRPWNELTAEEYRLANLIERRSIATGQPALLDGNLKLVSNDVTMTVHNLGDQLPLVDTLYWTIPDGWQVLPSKVAANIAPGEEQDFAFEVECTGDLFPQPELELPVEFAPGKSVRASQPLRLARTAHAVRVTEPVTIDGVLSELCWMKPETRYLNPDLGPATIDSTEIYFAWDDINLYLAARCFDARPDSIRANVSEHDGAIYSEDCVGFFFHPGKDTVYQIYINPIAIVFDQRITFKEDGWYTSDCKWDGTYEIKTLSDENGWMMEVCIPLESLGASTVSGETWDVNFRRKQKRLDTAGDWQPIEYYPSTFGYLLFE